MEAKNKIIPLILFFTTPAFAGVDLLNGAYFSSRSEAPTLTRNYNSQSLHRGLFGKGWSADFETSLIFIDENCLLLFDTTSGERFEFRKTKSPIFKTLFEDSKDKTHFIIQRGERFLEYRNDLILRIFDLNGKITFFRDSENHQIFLERTSEKIILRSHGFPPIELLIMGEKIQAVFRDGEQLAEYHYEQDLLINVLLKEGPSYKYKYDHWNNLITEKLGKKTTQLTYSEEDQVLKLKSANCIQEFQYATKDFSDSILQKVHFKEACSKQPIKTSLYSFHLEKRSKGISLTTLTIQTENETQRIDYDPLTGVPKTFNDQPKGKDPT